MDKSVVGEAYRRRGGSRGGKRHSPTAPANNGMHPTRDTTALIQLNLAGGRVMPSVRCLPKVNRMISRLKPLPCALLLLCCLVSGASRTTSAIASVHVPLKGENKRLGKFGVRLPASARIEAKINRAYSRAVHLFIKMPVDDLGAFTDLLEKIPRRAGREVYVWEPDSRLGSIPAAYDFPQEFIDRWKQTHSAKLGLVGFITFYQEIESGESKGEFQLKSYLVIFADKKKGLMWLYYGG